MESENKYIETDLGNVAPNPRGEYDPAAAYEYLDLVEYGGGSYLCIQESGTVTGVAPTQNKNTDTWQVLTIPGDLTAEYIAMHDDVVNKAESAQTDAAATAADREQVESMLANVEQLHTQTETAAQEASDSRDSAAGYAAAAEASRTAAADSEKNAQLQVAGFNETVNAAKQEATEEITTARKTAVQAVAAQQVKSVNAVNAAGSAAIEKTSADAKDAKDAKAAAVSAANAAGGSAGEATAAAEQAKNDKQSAETAATAAKTSAEAAETAKKAVEGAAGQIETNKTDITALKEDLAEHVFSKTKNVNLLDIDDSDVQHGFYNSTNGSYTANDNALTSGFIPYESDSVYRFTFLVDWFNFSVTLWDKNKSIVIADLSSFISKENGYATFSSTTYSNAKYVRFTIFDQSKDFSTAMVVKDVEYPSTYIPYDYTVKYSEKLVREIENIAKNINPVTIFDNKVILFTGDSICYGANWRPTVEDYSNTGWRKIIQENYQKSITYGYGIGGTTISKRSGRTDSILERMTKMFSEHPEADYIIIEGGVNDAYNITDCPIGTISTGYNDELNENTFAGALESIFKYAQTHWIGKKIGYIVTFKVPSAMGQFKFNEYMDIAKQICKKWSVPYCDLYNESNLNYFIQEVSDAYGGGLHPNEAGYIIITNKIEKWMETL